MDETHLLAMFIYAALSVAQQKTRANLRGPSVIRDTLQ